LASEIFPALWKDYIIIIIINRMVAEELTEYLILSQIDVQVRQVLDRTTRLRKHGLDCHQKYGPLIVRDYHSSS
jgi:hypothetical protein